MDYALFHAVNAWAGHVPWLDRAMTLIAHYAALLFGMALLGLWVRGRRTGEVETDRMAVARALVAAAVALAMGQVIGWGVPRPRPFTTHVVRLLIAPSADPSFPSDHALAAFAIAGALRGTHVVLAVALLAMGVLLGFARVFVGTHYPLDIVGGALLGGSVGLLTRWADAWLVPGVRLGSRVTDAGLRSWRTPTRPR